MITITPKFSCTISHKSSGTWATPGLFEALRAVTAPGTLSAAQIARVLNSKFGTNLTRLSVMGKCWREGIPLRPKATQGDALRKSVPVRLRLSKRPIRTDLSAPEPKGDVDHGCRYLHGDASERNFCGHDKHAPGSSWCEYHAAKVWSLAPQAVRRVA